jgi:16S rRNA G966 N2-methylase RsmD
MHTETQPWVVHHGDCLQVLKTLPDNSVDSVVTDPPYGLSFMGKKWDYDVPSEDIWRECLRVLKPGGHLLAFAGTRTQHRMAVRIEDAGFEIRDMIAWVYGSGFPKSLDVSKAIDKCNGEKDRILRFTQWYRTAGVSRAETTKAMIAAGHISENGTMAGHYFASSQAGQPAIPTAAIWKTLRPLCASVPAWVDELVARIEAEREVVGTKQTTDPVAWYCQQSRNAQTINITAPATEAAKQWHGWGTALKPALEPITVARKPLVGTVADNVLEHGTGALNVDGCRVGTRSENESGWSKTGSKASENRSMSGANYDREPKDEIGLGRWPANLIHDGSEEVVELFPQSGNGSGKQTIAKRQRSKGWCNSSPGEGVAAIDSYGDTGSAARFFYCAKASAKDRDEGVAGVAGVAGGMSGRRDGSMGSITMRKNTHPTVKPTDLMRYLCRLVTPPGGVVLDPFTGSGSTGKAAMLEGFRFVGIEREAEYVAIAQARIGKAADERAGVLL